MIRSFSVSAGLAAALMTFANGSVSANSDGWWVLNSDDWSMASENSETPYAIAVFGGEGAERNFSDTLENFHRFESSRDHLLAVSLTREIAWFRDQLSLEGEAMYGFHFGREEYHEFGVALYARWHDLPWNNYVATTMAAGMFGLLGGVTDASNFFAFGLRQDF